MENSAENNTNASATPADSVDTATGQNAAPELSTERVKNIFANIAKRYERFNAFSSLGAYRAWLQKMVDLSDIEPTDTVLDIAGGTGDVSFAVAKAKKPAKIICSDLVPEMLDVARAHDAEGASDGVPIEFEVVDAQDMPYEDDSFDAITMAYGLRNMPKREQALSEMFRVLKPGGSLTCLDFSTPDSRAWRGLYNIYLKGIVPLWGKIITGNASGFVYLADSIKAFPNQAGIASLMRKAGFEDIDWADCTGGIACVHTARKPN